MTKKTSLLPVITAVRIVWARTGTFSDDEHSNMTALVAEANLKEIKDRAKDAEPEEENFVFQAISVMDSCYRNLEILHKKRQLNFKDNAKLRTIHLDSIKDNLNFGNKAKDVLKSLPTMAIGGTVLTALIDNLAEELSHHHYWMLGLGGIAAGFLINRFFVIMARKRKQTLFIAQDYERAIYFDQFVSRVTNVLTALYLDLDRLHKNEFGTPYPVDDENANSMINNILKGIRPTFCKYVHRHMLDKKITPELWPICETGKPEAIKLCPFWEK